MGIPTNRFTVGTDTVNVAVSAIVSVVFLFAVLGRPKTFAGRISEGILVLLGVGLAGANLIFTMGDPLAGVVYWSAVKMSASALLPVTAILALIAWRQNEGIVFAWFALIITAGLAAAFILIS